MNLHENPHSFLDDEFSHTSGQGEVPVIDLSDAFAKHFLRTISGPNTASENSTGASSIEIDGEDTPFSTEKLDAIEPDGKPGRFLIRFKEEIGEHKVTSAAVTFLALTACAGVVRYYTK